jgi:RHS repeat-associated protein
MMSVTDRFGNATTLVYDGSGRVAKIEDPIRTYAGNKSYISLTYNSNGISAIKEPGPNGSQTGGRTTAFSVNGTDELVTVWQPTPLFTTTTLSYDPSHRLSGITDAIGAVTTLHYNTTSWLLDSISQPAVALDTGSGPVQTISPRVKFVPWQTVGLPSTTTSGAPVAPVDPDTVKARVTDPRGHVTAFTVNKWGQPRTITDTLGTTIITRNGILASSVVAPTGRTDNFTYNGPFLTELRLEGRKPQYFRYGAYGQVDSIWGPGLVPQYFFLGANGRVDSVRFAGTSVTRYTYDSRGRILTSRDPRDHVTNFHYESAFGNLDSTLAPGNLFTRVKHDGFGRDSAVQSTGLPWQRTIYDVLNRPTLVYDGVNADPIRYGYNNLYLTRVEDQKEQVYRFERNALGWLTREFDPADTLNRFVRYIHNADGLVTRTVNRRGDTVLVSYDGAHRIRSKYGQNVTVDSFAYAQGGLQVTAWNTVSRNELHLAKSGWQDSAVTEIAGKRFRLFYRPDTLLRLDSMNVASNSGITFMARGYRRSATTGMLDRIRLNSESIFLGTNLDLQPLTFTYPSIQTTHSWTANHTLYDKSFNKISVDTALRRAYGYDGQGRIVEALRRHQNQWAVRQYAYDSLGRLTKRGEALFASCAAADTAKGYNCMPDGATPLVTYSYDELGNRTDLTHVLAAGNRLQSWDDLSFTYDLDGNTLTRAEDGGSTRIFDWSADGLLRSVARSADTVQYGYDPFGRLVRKQRRGTTERYFLWDGDQLLAELNAAGTGRIAEYAYRPGVDRPLAFATGATAIDKIRYFAQDELGNVIGYFRDSTAGPQFSYGDWGGLSASAAVKDTNRLYWKGLLWEGDTTTHLYYVRNRWYDWLSGRFISEDPIGLAGGINKYVFASGDPVGGRDPFGLAPCRNVNDHHYHDSEGHTIYQNKDGTWNEDNDEHRRHTGEMELHDCTAYEEDSGESYLGILGTTERDMFTLGMSASYGTHTYAKACGLETMSCKAAWTRNYNPTVGYSWAELNATDTSLPEANWGWGLGYRNMGVTVNMYFSTWVGTTISFGEGYSLIPGLILWGPDLPGPFCGFACAKAGFPPQ